jgi:hypothetical protein
MSAAAPRSGTSHAGAWLGTVVLVFALYVGTWPFIEIRATKFRFGPHTLGGPHGSAHTPIAIRPAWHEIYRPLWALRRWEKNRGPLSLYWRWCFDLLDHEPEMVR